jgi:uncharacterized protein (TIGR02001 family)
MSIRRYAVAVTLCAGACLGPGTPSGQTLSNDLRASISLATDYRQNGLSQNYGKPSWRLAVDYEHDSGFFAGGFLANVEYEAEASRRTPRDLQADFYAGYVWRGSEWTTSVSMSRYIYPDIDFRYDYTLATASASFRDRYFFGVSSCP